MKFQALSLSLIFFTLTACGGGGGSSDSDGLVLEGTLIQGEAITHGRFLPKHSSGEPIDEVEVCALGACSVTDATGHWGFFVPGESGGEEIEITVRGHEIDSSVIVAIPADTEVAILDLMHEAGVIVASHLEFDGVHSESTSADHHE